MSFILYLDLCRRVIGMENIIILTFVCSTIGDWGTQFNKFKLVCTFDACTNWAGANTGSFNTFEQEDSSNDFRGLHNGTKQR